MFYYRFLIFVILLFSFSLVKAQSSDLITTAFHDSPIKEVLDQLETDFQLAFSYRSDLLQDERITVSIQKLQLEDALEKVFASTPIDFKLVNGRFVVLKKRTERLIPLRLCGKIVDAELGEPLAYANILIEDFGMGTTTNEDGYFELAGTFNEQLDLVATITYLGYNSKLIAIKNLSYGDCPSIQLSPAPQTMPEIIIHEFTTEMLDLESSSGKIAFTPEKIPTLPGWGEPDILRSLQLIPGISSSDESASNLNIRGGSSDQNLVLWDGIPIYHSGHFFGLYSSINPYVVDQVDVYRGNFRSEYGGRISGVIDMQGKSKMIDKPKYGIGLNLISAHARAEIPIIKKKLVLTLAARRAFTDIIRSQTYQNLFNNVFQQGRISERINLASEEPEISTESDFYFADYNLKWVWHPNKKDHFSFSSYLGTDDFTNRYNEGSYLQTVDDLALSNWGASLKYERNWNKKWITQIQGIISKLSNAYNYNFQLENNQQVQSYTNRLADYSMQLDQIWKINPNHQIKGGWQYSYQATDYLITNSSNDTLSTPFDEEIDAQTNSLFLEYKLNLFNRLDIDLGFRLDHYKSLLLNPIEGQVDSEVLNERRLQPRFSIRYQPLDEQLYFSFSGGVFRQFFYQIPPNRDDFGSNRQIWVPADDYFPSLKATQWTIGLSYEWNRFFLEIEYYQKRTSNLTSWKLEQETNLLNPLTQEGEGMASGLDILVKNKWGKYSTWMAYSIGQVETRFPEINGGGYFPSDYDQRHRFNWTHMLSLPNWDLSLSWHIHSGLPYTVPIGYESYLNEDDKMDYKLKYTGPNNKRLPTYHRLDIAGNYKFKRTNWLGKVGLSIFNVYNRVNLQDQDFVLLPPNADEGRSNPQIISIEREMLRFTPNLFVQFEW